MPRRVHSKAQSPSQLSAGFAELKASFSKECARISGLLDEHAQALQALCALDIPDRTISSYSPTSPSMEKASMEKVEFMSLTAERPSEPPLYSGPKQLDLMPGAPEGVEPIPLQVVSTWTINKEEVETLSLSMECARRPADQPSVSVPKHRAAPLDISVQSGDSNMTGSSGRRTASEGKRSTATDRAPDEDARTVHFGSQKKQSGTSGAGLAPSSPSEGWAPSRILKTGKRTQVSVFYDAKELEQSAEDAAWTGDYDVADLYHEKGWAQWIARHPAFSSLQFLAILANTVWIGIETDVNDKAILYEADAGVVLVENLFCVFFLWEWVVRLCAFRHKHSACSDFWFVFDTVLLIGMVFEVWVLFIVSALMNNSDAGSWPTDLLRLCRLARFSRSVRIARLLRSIPELTVIIRGLLVVTRTVFFICVLLTVLVYVFAILFVQFARDTDLNSDGSYDDVPAAMFTLVLGGLIPDMAPMTYAIARENAFFAALFLLFILFGFITIMNMLIGVLVQVVGVVATVETETNQLTQVKRLLLDSGLGFSEDELLTTEDLSMVFADDNVISGFRQLGIDTDDLFEHSKVVFRGREEIRLRDFWNLAVQHRGNNAVKVKDLVTMRQFIFSEISTLVGQVENLVTNKRGAAATAVSSPNFLP